MPSRSAIQSKIEALVEWFIPDSLRGHDVDEHRRARLAIYITSSAILVGSATGLFHFANGSPTVGVAYTSAGIIAGMIPPLLRWTGSLVIAGNAMAFLMFASHALVVFLTGGLGLPALVTQVGAPMLAIALAGPRSGAIWAALCIGLVLGVYSLHLVNYPFPYPLEPDALVHHQISGAMAGVLIIVTITLIYESMKRRTLRELEAALKRERTTREQLVHQEKLASVGQLAAGVAHEINNPLSFIRSNLSHLGRELARNEEADPDEIEEILNETIGGADRIQEITGALVQFSRKNTLDPEITDICGLVRGAARVSRNEIHPRAELELDLPDDLPGIVCIPGEIQQVLVNLLLNAAHAIELTGRYGTIRVEVADVRDTVEIRVIDDGTGMPADLIDHIFDPFFTTKEVGKGTGLGLSVSYGILYERGGSIKVESEEGTGSRFTVVLPRNLDAATSRDAVD
jgi:signal transduction histidine kinase